MLHPALLQEKNGKNCKNYTYRHIFQGNFAINSGINHKSAYSVGQNKRF